MRWRSIRHRLITDWAFHLIMVSVATNLDFAFWRSTGGLLLSFIFISLLTGMMVWIHRVQKLVNGFSRQFLTGHSHKTLDILRRLGNKLSSQELIMRQVVEEMEKIGNNELDHDRASIDG